MTKREIISLYSQIEGLTTSEIKTRVALELSDNGGFVAGGAKDYLKSAIGATSFNQANALSVFPLGIVARAICKRKPKVSPTELKDACNKSWDLNLTQIRTIINNNPKTSRCIMDIVVLLAPAIAQQFSGMSGMAIVGTLTIICKQNLGL